MTEQVATGEIAIRNIGGEATERHRGASSHLKLTTVFVTVVVASMVALGLSVAWFLGGDAWHASIGASVATVCLVPVVIVLRRSARRQQADVQRRVDEVHHRYDSIVAVLCAALDLRDDVAHGQARRVCELASVVAWQMGLRKQEVRRIEKAAILHNIGKIGIADAVLSKPGPLDDAEWAEMKRHPELGYQVLQGVDFLRDAAEIVYTHHERYDGSGYPRGLKGDEIPLGARIFAVVDAYDAITSYRPYRRAQPHRKAVEEIVRNSGLQFDPDVVRAFVEAEKQGLLEDPCGNGKRELDASVADINASVASRGQD